MLLKWNKTNVWSIGSGMADGSVVQLIPGNNQLTEHQWKCIKDHPEVKLRMKKDIICLKRGKIKMLEIIGAKKEKKENKGASGNEGNEGSEGAKSLEEVNVKEAAKLIKETFNTVLLAQWKESETRSSVLKVIEKQLEDIEKMNKDENGGNEANVE